MKKRVVITGMGAVTPIGNNVNSFWNNLLKGSNGISEITQFDTENFKTKLAAEVKIDLNIFFSTKELNILDRFSSLALIAADEAIQMSNLMSKDFNKNSVGVANKYGNKAFFSFLYKPGATNFQICINIIGLVTNMAAKKATFKYVIKVSCNAVKIILLSIGSSLTASA